MTSTPDNPYFLGTINSFKELVKQKKDMEADFRPDIVSEYTEVSKQYLSTAIELIKLGVDRVLTEDSIILDIDDEDYVLPRKSVYEQVGEKQWNILFPLEEMDKEYDYDDDFDADFEKIPKATSSVPTDIVSPMVNNPFAAFISALCAPFLNQGYGNPVASQPTTIINAEPTSSSDIFDDLSEFKKKIYMLEKERDSAQETVSVVKQKYDALKRRVREKDEQLANERKNNDELLRGLDEEIDGYKRQIDELDNCAQQAIASADEREKKIEELTATIESKKRAIEAVKGEKSNVLNQLRNSKAEYEEYIKKAEAEKKRITEDGEFALKQAGDELAKMKEELKNLRKESQSQNEAAQGLRGNLSKANQEIAELRTKNTSLQKEFDDYKVKARKDADEELQRARKQADDSVAHAKKESEETIARIKKESEEALNKAKVEQQEAITRARKEAEETISKVRKESDERLSQTKTEVENAASVETQKANQRIKELESQIKEFKDKQAQDSKKISELQDKVSSMASERDKANSEKTRIIKEKETLSADMDKLMSASSEKDEQIKKLENLAYRDERVGTLNNNAFNRDFPACDINKSVLIMLGIRDIKAVNAMHGRPAGDRIINMVSMRLVEMYGSDCVYRILGDQFVVILSDISVAEVNNQMSGLRAELFNENIGIAYGVAAGSSCSNYGEFLGNAERAMNEMKSQSVNNMNSGGNGYQMPNSEPAPAQQTSNTPEEVDVGSLVMQYMQGQS